MWLILCPQSWGPPARGRATLVTPQSCSPIVVCVSGGGKVHTSTTPRGRGSLLQQPEVPTAYKMSQLLLN